MRRALLALALLAEAVVFFATACGGQSGSAAAPGPTYDPGPSTMPDATVNDARTDVSVAPAPLVALGASVNDLTSHAPIANVLVVVEVGGLDQPNPAAVGPDGGPIATVAWNPLFQYGALTDDAGLIRVDVSGGPVGLHAFANGYLEGTGGPWDAGPDAGSIPLRFLGALPEGGADRRPQVHGLTADPPYAAPGAPVLFTVVVDAPSFGELTDEVLLVLPATHQAWALASPAPAAPGGAYPPGIYSRIVTAPDAPGTYTFDLVAAANGGAASDRLQTVLTVNADGTVPLADSGVPGPRDGGLPDGRR
jgi:hypothetical protein